MDPHSSLVVGIVSAITDEKGAGGIFESSSLNGPFYLEKEDFIGNSDPKPERSFPYLTFNMRSNRIAYTCASSIWRHIVTFNFFHDSAENTKPLADSLSSWLEDDLTEITLSAGNVVLQNHDSTVIERIAHNFFRSNLTAEFKTTTPR